jgi:hypothetical protein
MAVIFMAISLHDMGERTILTHIERKTKRACQRASAPGHM